VPTGSVNHAGAAFVVDAAPGELLRTFAPEGKAGANFGWSATIQGHYVAIGARDADVVTVNGTFTGAGRVYVYDLETGAQVQNIANPTPSLNAEFGATLSGQGRVLAVGSALARTVQLLDLLSGNLITSVPGVLSAGFDGDRLAVPGADNTEYLYKFDGTQTSLVNVLRDPTAPADGSSDLYGWFTTMLPGDLMAVSAPFSTFKVGATTFSGAGQVYVYDRRDGTLVQTLHAPVPANGTLFGYSMSAVGDRLLIGQLIGANGQQGVAYLVDPATGAFLHTFTNPVGGAFQNYPGFVAGSGGRAMLSGTYPGAPVANDVVSLFDASGIDTLAPLSGLTHLRSLSAAHQHVATLPAMAGWDALANVYLGDNRLSDVSTLNNVAATIASADLRFNPLNNAAFDLALAGLLITPNDAPVINTPIGPRSTSINTPLTFLIDASEPNLTFTYVKATSSSPADVSITLSGRQLTLVPRNGFTGTVQIPVVIADGPTGTGDWRGRTVGETFDFSVGVGAIYGSKFLDANQDGVRDAGETPLAGETVYLDQNGNGTFDAGERVALTDAQGDYVFRNLTTGTYSIGSVQRANWFATGAPQTQTINVTAGAVVTGIDFGAAPLVDIGPDVAVDEGTPVDVIPTVTGPVASPYPWILTDA
jgi:hypothetical protein